LTAFIPNEERVVLIEDTSEIQIQKDNVLRFGARREQNGLSAVTIRDPRSPEGKFAAPLRPNYQGGNSGR